MNDSDIKGYKTISLEEKFNIPWDVGKYIATHISLVKQLGL
jgi:hypothetical protein